MNKIHTLRKFFWKLGYDLHAFNPYLSTVSRQRLLFKNYNINLLIDIGANIGHYVDMVRTDLEYKGKVISFEPTQSAFKILKLNSDKDKNWDAYNYGIGNENSEMEISISENSESSSFLEISEKLLNASPESKFVAKEKILVKTIDSLYPTLFSNFNNIFLKIDTQGFEYNIILGAKESLKFINTIQLEMSIEPLYKNEVPFAEMYKILTSYGYKMVSIETGYLNNKGEMLQLDAIFHRD